MSTLPDALVDRFKRFKFRHFDQNVEHYEELAQLGQHPEVMIVSCCDSRVSPETIFSALPGELFVLRNIANLVPPYETRGVFHGVSAALEFAVLNLRIKHIVVMGHAGCGGVKAALNGGASHETEAHFISNWISMLQPRIAELRDARPQADAADFQLHIEHESVKVSLDHLRTFPFVQAAENSGQLNLHGTWFDIGAGKLEVLNPATGNFHSV